MHTTFKRNHRAQIKTYLPRFNPKANQTSMWQKLLICRKIPAQQNLKTLFLTKPLGFFRTKASVNTFPYGSAPKEVFHTRDYKDLKT